MCFLGFICTIRKIPEDSSLCEEKRTLLLNNDIQPSEKRDRKKAGLQRKSPASTNQQGGPGDKKDSIDCFSLKSVTWGRHFLVTKDHSILFYSSLALVKAESQNLLSWKGSTRIIKSDSWFCRLNSMKGNIILISFSISFKIYIKEKQNAIEICVITFLNKYYWKELRLLAFIGHSQQGLIRVRYYPECSDQL